MQMVATRIVKPVIITATIKSDRYTQRLTPVGLFAFWRVRAPVGYLFDMLVFIFLMVVFTIFQVVVSKLFKSLGNFIKAF